MKKISPSIVMVEDIASSKQRENFQEEDLKKAAELILELEGTVNPPVLKKDGIDSYSVINGHFEYYAAVKAEEIDPMKAETINAYVVESEEDVLLYEEQIELFRHREDTPPQPIVTIKETEFENHTRLFDAFQKNTKRMDDRQAQQDKHISELIKKVNSLDETIAKLLPPDPPIVDSEFLKDFNDKKNIVKFKKKLGRIGIKGLPAKALFEAIGKINLLSLEGLSIIKGVGGKTIEKIRDNWE